jgi:hypothetical protein
MLSRADRESIENKGYKKGVVDSCMTGFCQDGNGSSIDVA